MKSFAYPRLTSIVAVFFCFCALTFFKVVRHIEANSTSSLPTRDTTAIDSIRNLPSHETDSTSTDRHAARLNNESIKMGVGMLSSSQPGAANFDVLAGTINVNTTADENGTGAGCSLREAIISANTNANFGGCTGSGGGSPFTINVPAGTYTLTAGDIQIGTTSGANITISGTSSSSTIIQQGTAGCTGAKTARVFELDPSVLGNVAVTITGVTISNGAAQSFGGGAILGGGTNDSLTLSNAVLSNNCTSGAFSAAGISWSPDGNVTISNTTFSNNVSGQGAGAILYTTGTNAGSGRTLAVTNSTFTGNTAASTGSAGGAILMGQNGSFTPTFNINGNTFTTNQATNAAGIGGALYIGGGTLNLGNTSANRFFGNTAGVTTSGGLGVRGGTATATNNWWGCNTGPGIAGGCDRADNSGGALNFTPWVVLTNTASPSTIQVNQTATLTADVLHNSSGGSLPVGQVSVLIGRAISWGSAVRGTISGQQTTIQSNGTATATFTANAVGAGSANATVDNTVGTASITISKANTTTTITSDTPDPSVTGQSVTINFHVTSSTGSTPTAPTGSVTISDGTISCSGSINASGDGSCNLTFTSAGSRSLTATNAGDGNFNSSSSTPATSHAVNNADTATSVSSSQNPSLTGQSVTFTATVSVTSPGAGTPTGSVDFLADGSAITGCSGVALSGLTAQCATSGLSAATHTITAKYNGDTNFNTSSGTLSGGQAVSNTAVWDGSASSDWSDLNNWATNFVPGSTHDVSIPSSGVTNNPTISAASVTINSLTEAIGRTLTINSGRNLGVTGTCSLAGSMIVAGSFTCGSMSGTGSVSFTGAAAQTIPALTYNNLTMNNAAGASLAGNITVDGVLTLLNGNIDAGANTLSLGTGGSITRTSGYILGNLQKSFGGTGTFTFQVGASNGYSPVDVTVTAGTGQLTVKADQGTAPATVPLDSSKTLNRFWSLSGSGITASLKFSYQQADVFGNEANYKLIRVASGVAIPSANGTPCPGAGSPCVDTTANTIFVAGVTSFAPYYTAGELTPTAAAVGIAGRAVDASGRGIPRALVTITDDAGNTFMTITNPFGYYSFPNLTAGQTYVIAASHKQFHFDARAVSLNDGVSGFDLIGKP